MPPSLLTRRALGATVFAGPLLARTRRAHPANRYDQGANDHEIKLGTTSPYSGPASSYAQYGKAQVAYFHKLNEQGGVNGRKVDLISLDDAYSPPKTVEQTRRLVEAEGVLAIAGPLGTAPNAAIQKYLNAKKVPQLFLTSGGTRFNNPTAFPWSIPLHPSFDTIGRVFARHVLARSPHAKIGVLYLNDDLGRDHLGGLRAALGERAASMLVSEQSHEVTDPSVDSQIVTVHGSGADTVFLFTTAKFAAQAIRKIADLGWTPERLLSNTASSKSAALIPAGLDRSRGVITASWYKRVDDPEWGDTPDMRAFTTTMTEFLPGVDLREESAVFGYVNAAMVHWVLAACGDELTRANILEKATHLPDVAPPLLLPGIRLSNSPDDYAAFHKIPLARFDGTRWISFGDLVDLSRT
jgi:ABC-type branched-subunit amino acid transport system substrate-binding protein